MAFIFQFVIQMYANANAIVAAYGCKGSSVDPTEAIIGGATGSKAAYGPNIIAAVEVILGTFEAQGKLPVNIPVFDFETKAYTDEIVYERGFGLTYEAVEGENHTWNGLECEYCDATRVNPFSDVPTDAYYTNAILWAAENRIAAGTSDTSFSPYDPCLRAQAITFLWRAAGSPKAENPVNPFVDVFESDYYYDAVLWAVENGIVYGVDATHFAPLKNCTRSEIVTFLWRAEGRPMVEGGHPFLDTQAGAFYENALIWAYNTDLAEGLTATFFGPNVTCIRCQIVSFLYRAR